MQISLKFVSEEIGSGNDSTTSRWHLAITRTSDDPVQLTLLNLKMEYSGFGGQYYARWYSGSKSC